jgi:class III cytochrome C family protein
MKKIIQFFIVSLTACSVFLIASAFSQDDMVAVDNSVFSKPQRPPAVFVHDTHNETANLDECSTCHHIFEDGELLEDESSEDQSCSDCHEEKAMGQSPSLRRAFHLQCKGCHMTQKAGPVMCAECHRKHG